MKKRRFIHGTSYESAMKIKKEGFQEVKDMIWTCSDSSKIYLRELLNDENLYYETLYSCIESAQIASAVSGSTNPLVGVICLMMDDSIACELEDDGYLESDDSCENMEDCLQLDIKKLNELIAKGLIEVDIQFCNAYHPNFRLFYLRNLNMNYLDLDESLEEDIKILQSYDTYIEEIFEYDTSEIVL